MTANIKATPKLSVIVPVYNAEPYLKRCLDSIFAQDFADFEIILVLELRSTDKSEEICQNFANKDKRVRILSENGTGCSAARNRGLDGACGRYVTFIDADDAVRPEMFGAMFEKALNFNLDVYCCSSKKGFENQSFEEMRCYMEFSNDFFAVDADNQKQVMYKLAVNGRAGTVWAKMFKRDFLLNQNLRFNPSAYSEDYVFSVMSVMAAKRVGSTDEVFYVYFDRSESRIYKSTIDDIKKSAELLWKTFQAYNGADVKAYAAARIVSSALFNLKLKKLPVETSCGVVEEIISKLGLRPYLEHAADDNCFEEYARITGMRAADDNYLMFIRSLQNYSSMLAWQKQYLDGEKRGKA